MAMNMKDAVDSIADAMVADVMPQTQPAEEASKDRSEKREPDLVYVMRRPWEAEEFLSCVFWNSARKTWVELRDATKFRNSRVMPKGMAPGLWVEYAEANHLIERAKRLAGQLSIKDDGQYVIRKVSLGHPLYWSQHGGWGKLGEARVIKGHVGVMPNECLVNGTLVTLDDACEANNKAVAEVGIRLDEFSRHEALDRTHLVRAMLEDYLISHPYIVANEKLKRQLEAASSLLWNVYQSIGDERQS